MDATTLGLIIALIVAVAALAAVGLKLYSVAQAAVGKLPPNSSQQQQISAALDAIMAYLQANPSLDKVILQDILTIITLLGQISGVDVTNYTGRINNLMMQDGKPATS